MSTSLTALGTAFVDRMRELDEAMSAAQARIVLAGERNAEMAEGFIGKKEAAAFLNMSVSTLERRMAEKLGPPRYTDGGKTTFLRTELKRWREKWRVGIV